MKNIISSLSLRLIVYLGNKKTITFSFVSLSLMNTLLPLHVNKVSNPRIDTIPNLHLHISSHMWKILIFLYIVSLNLTPRLQHFASITQCKSLKFSFIIFFCGKTSLFSRFGCHYVEMTFDVRSVEIQT